MDFSLVLVRGAWIVVCDEASSSVVFATGEKVLATMEAFEGKTLVR